MTSPISAAFIPADLAAMASQPAPIAVFVEGAGVLTAAAKAADAASGGAVSRLLAGGEFKAERGAVAMLAHPHGIAAPKIYVVGLGERKALDAGALRETGGKLAARLGKAGAVIYADGLDAAEAAQLTFGAVLRLYRFGTYLSKIDETVPTMLAVATADAAGAKAAYLPLAAVAEGTFFTRDLVNEPANVLDTGEFSARLGAMRDLGLEVTVMGEAELGRLGMRALLGVGQGSAQESRVVVMKWMGGEKGAAPLALVGKGVVFDTGGISIKPAGGMEEMTMDMGGAGVVAGVMRALALRKARANVVGVVGLVENMPDGMAQRPGDIVRSMKGDTIEIINTDAEGRLVLADALWFTQETFKPAAMIDLATLTGAVIIALGHENAGVMSNNDDLAGKLTTAARTAGEGLWRLPLGEAYDKKIKSRLADMKNTGGRDAGSITAAQFLQRFVKPEIPWAHLDIAGVALVKDDRPLHPNGATGWGVRTLDQLVRDAFES